MSHGTIFSERFVLKFNRLPISNIIVSLYSSQAVLKVSGALQKSTDIMKMVNQLARLPEISAAMQELSMEMTKVDNPY